MAKDLLIEIGTEEIPARFIPQALADLKKIFIDELHVKRRISFDADLPDTNNTIETMATPRRLAVIVRGLPEMQDDRSEEVFGPPKKAAYDAEGNLTKAALGFARSQGVEPEALTVKDKDGKGEYIAAIVEEAGRPVADVLPEALRDVVLGLHFPKSMRWGDGTIRFARPIHWIVALYGSDVVEFELEGIVSGRLSRGHRFLAPVEVPIENPDSYVGAMGEHFVSVGDRMGSIRADSDALAAEVGGKIVWDDELLTHVANIVEYPVPVRCGFEQMYLELPDELLAAVMVGHQKYFPVSGSDGALVNSFIIVSNTKPDNADTVRRGAERVCRARFEDARFYFEDDRGKHLADRLEDLKKVTFQDKLGSVYDKTMRMKAVAGELAGMICPGDIAVAERAAELAKTDLVTGVVFEFPELQGIMGMYYARLDGEGEAVAQAIREQYLPGFSGDRVPDSDAGAVVSLADRADNIASFFSIGLRPTGSEDPFALRRQALGIVAILNERVTALSVADVMAPALRGREDFAPDVFEFFSQRLEHLFSSGGYAHDLVQSVLAISVRTPLHDVYARLEALCKFKEHERYNEFLIAIKRVRNIIPEHELPSPKEEILSENAEKALWRGFYEIGSEVSDLASGSDFSGAIERMLDLAAPVNTFFDEVLVMDKDEDVRLNRLGFLFEIWKTASNIADFSSLLEHEA